jgi:phosphocarrier protein
MIEQTVVIQNRAGIHARPSAVLVQATKNFKADIFFENSRGRINAKSIMGVITMGAAYGSEVKIIAKGEDEKEAVEAVKRLIESKFEEE